jgi:hypothetical protein
VRFGTLLKLLLASLVVGFLLTWLEVEPTDLVARSREALVWAFAQVRTLTDDLVDSAGDVVGYVLVGAVVVVPIWLVSVLWKALRRRQSR